MKTSAILTQEELKYLSLLSEKYPSTQAVYTELINLQAILNLPKGTEHFMSDLHGEYEAFCHIINNCSGVIREKVELVMGDRLSQKDIEGLCTLIYYPEQKLEMIVREGNNTADWYRLTLLRLIELAKVLSSKYTRSKVRQCMPADYRFIIDELLHAQPDEDTSRLIYHSNLIDTLISLQSGNEFITALATLIKRLAVDHLHIVGDIFDRGPRPDSILDLLMEAPAIDIEWGNHDILWMGAAAGSEACISAVVRNCLSYENMDVLERGYGISLRPLTLFAEKTYTHCKNPTEASYHAISMILFKLEGQTIQRHPDYDMEDRLLLDKIDLTAGTVQIGGKSHRLNYTDFPTLNPDDPYSLTIDESRIINDLKAAFQESDRLYRHISFLYEKGSMYRCFNQNLLYHGCIPLDSAGNFQPVTLDGKTYLGKAYMDYADQMARKAFFDPANMSSLDFMWYLWSGSKSPLCGRRLKTFERMFIADKRTWEEEKDPYYTFYNTEPTCNMILHEFGLFSDYSHIVNGHTPIRVAKGEKPIRANGKLLVIDGGFCKAYQKSTGIAGYTLIYNSHGLRLKSHQPFTSLEDALEKNLDIQSDSSLVETQRARTMIMDTDAGKEIQMKITDLQALLEAYRSGILIPKAYAVRGVY